MRPDLDRPVTAVRLLVWQVLGIVLGGCLAILAGGGPWLATAAALTGQAVGALLGFRVWSRRRAT